MSIALQGQVAALQARVAELEKTVAGLLEIIVQSNEAEVLVSASPKPAPTNPNGPRQMCPKCHEKPNNHLHVRFCKGKASAGAPI